MSKTVNKIPNVKIDKKTFTKDITNLSELAKNGQWSYFYDNDLDELYFTPKSGVSEGYNLIQVTDELSCYIDDKSQLGGVMIPYFSSNLSSHEDLFKPYKRIFTKSITGGKTAPKKSEDKINSLTFSIMTELQKSAKTL